MKVVEIAEFVENLYEHKISKLEANKVLLEAFQEKEEIENREHMIASAQAEGVAPITPSQVDFSIPEFVIEAVNELIEDHKNAGGKEFAIKQDDIMNLILKKTKELGMEEIDRNYVFKKKWLDFEEDFIKFGWKVGYYKPDRTESFSSYFTFEPEK